MTTWRVVTGSLDDSQDPHGEWAWTWSDVYLTPFNEARNALLGILGRFVDNNRGQCEDCVSQGEGARAELAALVAGAEFHGEVDGHDYCLLRAP
jgi:hypothetical protein